MAGLLIGSSNIRKFYDTKSATNLRFEVATIRRSFDISLDSVKNGERVIISVIENFIEKAIMTNAGLTEDEKYKAMTEEMVSFMERIDDCATVKPLSKFALAYPIGRPANRWMSEREDDIRKEFERSYNRKGRGNIYKIDAIAKESQNFEKDGVHLTKESGSMFVNNLLDMAEGAFESELVEESEDEVESIFSKVKNAGKVAAKAVEKANLLEMKKDTTDLKLWKKNFETDINNRFKSDNIMFARIRDELDAEINRKKEDRTLVMGISEPADLPRGGVERAERLKTLTMDFCKKVKPDFDGQILYAGTCGAPLNGKMRIEFRLESVEKARDIRKTFAMDRSSKKLDPELEGYQVMTMITLATRIRMDIMKAIAKRIESATESAYVPNFLSRPILHIKKKAVTPASQVRSLTFADAVTQFGGELQRGDLDIAYDKAKGQFRGVMRQHFIVFADPEPASWSNPSGTRGPGSSRGKGPTGAARGTKRSGDSEGSGGGFKHSRL
jgi:hypothetical protein